MNLLFLCLFPPALDGSGFANEELTKCLSKQGHSINVIAQPCKSDKKFDDSLKTRFNIEVTRVPFRLIYEDTPPPKEQLEIVGRLINQHLILNRPDVVVVGHESWCWYNGIIQNHSLPIIQYLHGTPTREILSGIYPPQETSLFKENICKADHIIAVAHHFKKIVIDFGYPSKQITTIYNAVDFTLFKNDLSTIEIENLKKKLGFNQDQRLILHASNHFPVKRVLDIFKSAERVLPQSNSDNIAYILLGEGPDTNKLRTFLQESSIKSKFHIVGRVAKAQVADYMKISELFILSSESEGFPRVIAEAQAASLPVLVSDMDAGIEVTQNGKLGGLYEMGNIKSLTEKTLVFFDRNPSNIRKETELAKELILKIASAEKQVSSIEKILNLVATKYNKEVMQ